MRARAAVLALILLLAALWWVTRGHPAPPAVLDPPRVGGHGGPPLRPAGLDPVAMTPPPAERARQVAALTVLAEATGRYVVGCPDPRVDGPARHAMPGVRAVGSPTGAGFTAMVDEPTGVVEVWESHEEAVGPGMVVVRGPHRLRAVLRWRTDADGQTRCAQEEPAPRPLRVSVVDEDGQPLAGATVDVLGREVPGVRTGADGWATLEVYTEDPLWLSASLDSDVSEREWVGVGDAAASLVIARTDRTPEEGWEEMRQARIAAAARARDELAAALASPGVPPEVAAVLTQWREELARGARSAGATPARPVGSPDSG